VPRRKFGGRTKSEGACCSFIAHHGVARKQWAHACMLQASLQRFGGSRWTVLAAARQACLPHLAISCTFAFFMRPEQRHYRQSVLHVMPARMLTPLHSVAA
jgi:hypothetical protein